MPLLSLLALYIHVCIVRYCIWWARNSLELSANNKTKISLAFIAVNKSASEHDPPYHMTWTRQGAARCEKFGNFPFLRRSSSKNRRRHAIIIPKTIWIEHNNSSMVEARKFLSCLHLFNSLWKALHVISKLENAIKLIFLSTLSRDFFDSFPMLRYGSDSSN